MHVTFDSLKTFYNILVQKLKNHRGNWNQNDPTADDYIKNRPFYTSYERTVIVKEQTVNIEEDNGYIELEHNAPSQFIAGQTYIVMFNGIKYECVAWNNNDSACCIGNGDIYGGEGMGGNEPFSCDSYDDLTIYLNVLKEGAYTISISVAQEVVKKLDKKFIDMPDDIVTSEELNEVIDNIDNIDNQLNNLSRVAFSGNYYDLNGCPTVYGDIVRYSYQNLTDQQKSQVRTNIGAGENIVSYGYFSHYNIYTTTLSSTDYHDQTREIYLKKIELNAPDFNNLESCDVAKVNFLNKIWYCRASTIELSFADNSDTSICFGNKSLYSITEEDTGEPFLLVPSYDAHRFNQKGIYFAKTEADEVIEICANSDNSFIQLDEMLIPDTIARVDDIQTYVDEAIENLDIPSGDSNVDLTGYATETYVNDAVAAIVNSAPDALNTLDELAAALGDDQNFATTVTNQIAGKLDASALTGAINDALAQAKASGEFNGADGQDYVLTPADKTEIAEMAADLVEIPEQESGDSDLFIVTLTATSDTAGTSSHTPSEIKAAVDSGKMATCVLDGTGMTFDLTFVGESIAMFNRVSVSSVDGTDDRCETVMTMAVINSNKEVSLDMQSAMGVPAGGTEGQILASDENGNPVWTDMSNGEETEYLTVTLSDDGKTASHSLSEIVAAVNEGKIPRLHIHAPESYLDFAGSDLTARFTSVSMFHFDETDGLFTYGGRMVETTYHIDNDKNVTTTFHMGETAPMPEESDYGKVLSATEDGLKWIDAPTGDSNNVLVTLSGSTMTSNFSASEIIGYINSNKIVHAIVTDFEVMSGFVFTPLIVDENDPAVAFHAEFVEDGDIFSALVIIYEDKTFETDVQGATGIPSGGTEGQVLTADANGKPVWSDANNLGSSILIVNIDNNISSHTPKEINDAFNAGKMVYANSNNVIYNLHLCAEQGALFSKTSVDTNPSVGVYVSTGYISIAEDKTAQFFGETAVGVPSGGTAGQILVTNANGVSEWANPDTIEGAKGDTGDTGADGYTPVRGTDYWTEADKAEIKSYVDEAILGGEW